jgi:hypothetical protein
MKTKYKKPPHAGSELYKNIFGHKVESFSIQLISDGLKNIMKNASRLLTDVQILMESQRMQVLDFY